MKPVLNTNLAGLGLALSGLFLAAGQAMSADVAVDLNTTYQTIDGFGGMQDKGWTGYNLTTADRNLLYGTGAGQIGLTIMRIRVNENSSNWSYDLSDAKDVISRGFKVFATAWNPPGGGDDSKGIAGTYRETYTNSSGATRYRIKSSMYNDYATHLNSFISYMKTNGVALYGLGIQNEPDYDVDWTGGTATDMYNLTKSVCPQIQNTKCISPESFSFNKAYYDPILNDATVFKSVGILGTHFYATSKTTADATFDYTLFKQKGGSTPFWMTEVYTADVNNNTSNTWPLCLDAAYEIHRALALSNMSAYVWWYLKRHYGPLYSPSGNESSQGTVSKIGYIMGQYSKYIRPGAVRVSATRNVQTDVYTAAFKKNDSVVVVSVNRASSSKSVTFSIPGLKSTSGAKITTSGTKGLTDDGTVSVSNGNFSTTLDAQSISTFVFTGNGTTALGAWNSVATATGVYQIYSASGARIGAVQVGEGQLLDAEVRKIVSKSGLYIAKPAQGSVRRVSVAL